MNRTERRRQAKADRRLVAGGLDSNRRDLVQVMALMRVLHDLVEESRNAGTVAPLMSYLHENIRSADRAVPRKALACRRGCAHCCHAWVSARAPEILFARAAVPAVEREAVAGQVDRIFAVTGTLDPEARTRNPVPCPLLHGELCRIYAARPMTCRTAASTDADACERGIRFGEAIGIPTPDFHIRARAGYALALAGALKRAGFPATAYELVSGLRSALSRPDAEEAWLAGEDVFASAVRDPVGDLFDNPRNRQVYDAAWA